MPAYGARVLAGSVAPLALPVCTHCPAPRCVRAALRGSRVFGRVTSESGDSTCGLSSANLRGVWNSPARCSLREELDRVGCRNLRIDGVLVAKGGLQLCLRNDPIQLFPDESAHRTPEVDTVHVSHVLPERHHDHLVHNRVSQQRAWLVHDPGVSARVWRSHSLCVELHLPRCGLHEAPLSHRRWLAVALLVCPPRGGWIWRGLPGRFLVPDGWIGAGCDAGIPVTPALVRERQAADLRRCSSDLRLEHPARKL